MTPTEAIEYIHSRLTFGIHPGMERIEALCAAVGNPTGNQLETQWWDRLASSIKHADTPLDANR